MTDNYGSSLGGTIRLYLLNWLGHRCAQMTYGRFHYYPMLGGRTMTDQEEQSLKEAKRKEKRATEEIE